MGHVAGTIGARQDSQGVVGVDWRVRLMPLKFIGRTARARRPTQLRAVLYAAANGAQVTNNSYGGDGFSQTCSTRSDLERGRVALRRRGR